jgi:hypothetical protein
MSATRTWRVCRRSVTSTSTCSGVTPSPCPSRWPVVNCDRSAARPPCLMMLESEFLLRCYSDPSINTDCCSGFFTGTNRMEGRVTASQIAAASAASFLLRLT